MAINDRMGPLAIYNQFLGRSTLAARANPLQRSSPSFSLGESPSPLGASSLLLAAAAAGQLSQAYNAFHQARMAAYEQKSQASALRHRSRMLLLDRRAAEAQAETVMEAGQDQLSALATEGGQRRAEQVASLAARGLDSSVGSAAEGLASDRLMESIDAYNINLSTVRQANAIRRGAMAIGNEADSARVSGRNIGRAARRAAPEADLFAGIVDTGIRTEFLRQYRST